MVFISTCDRETTGLLTTGLLTTGHVTSRLLDNWSFGQLVFLTTGLLDNWSFGQLVFYQTGLEDQFPKDQLSRVQLSKRPVVQKTSCLEAQLCSVQLSKRPVVRRPVVFLSDQDADNGRVLGNVYICYW